MPRCAFPDIPRRVVPAVWCQFARNAVQSLDQEKHRPEALDFEAVPIVINSICPYARD